jgi:hypothetical protein
MRRASMMLSSGLADFVRATVKGTGEPSGASMVRSLEHEFNNAPVMPAKTVSRQTTLVKCVILFFIYMRIWMIVVVVSTNVPSLRA